jgi:hypothetical protein
MKLNRSFIVTLAGTAIIATAWANQGGILLRRQLVEGSTERYQIQMKMATNVEMPGGLGDQELGVTTEGTYDIKVGKMNWQIPGAAIETTITLTKMEAEGIMAGAFGDKVPPPATTAGTLDIFGRLRSKAAAPSVGSDPLGQGMSSSILTIELPEKPISIGESWKITVPKSPLTKEAQFLTATLTDERDGALAVKLAGTYHIEMAPRKVDAAEAGGSPMQGQRVGIKGDITIEGTGALDRASGKTLWLTTKTKTKQEVSMPDMGMKINSESTVDSSVKLLQ